VGFSAVKEMNWGGLFNGEFKKVLRDTSVVDKSLPEVFDTFRKIFNQNPLLNQEG